MSDQEIAAVSQMTVPRAKTVQTVKSWYEIRNVIIRILYFDHVVSSNDHVASHDKIQDQAEYVSFQV